MSKTPTPTCDEEDEHADGCLCSADKQVQEHEATHDHDLPAATGNVQGDKPPRQPKRSTRGLAKVGEL